MRLRVICLPILKAILLPSGWYHHDGFMPCCHRRSPGWHTRLGYHDMPVAHCSIWSLRLLRLPWLPAVLLVPGCTYDALLGSSSGLYWL